MLNEQSENIGYGAVLVAIGPTIGFIIASEPNRPNSSIWTQCHHGFDYPGTV